MSHAETIDLITERVLEFMQAEERSDRYPNRAHFIAADHPAHGEMVSSAFAEGHPVVLVFPNGDEVVIELAENGTPMRVEARAASGKPLAA